MANGSSGGRRNTSRNRFIEEAVQQTNPVQNTMDLFSLVESFLANSNRNSMTGDFSQFDPNLTHQQAYQDVGLPEGLAVGLGLFSSMMDPGPGGEAKAVRRGANAVRGNPRLRVFRAESPDTRGPVNRNIHGDEADPDVTGGSYWASDPTMAASYGRFSDSPNPRVVEGQLATSPDRVLDVKGGTTPENMQRFVDSVVDSDSPFMRRMINDWQQGAIDDAELVMRYRDEVGHKAFGERMRQNDFDALIQYADDSTNRTADEVVVFNRDSVSPVQTDSAEEFDEGMQRFEEAMRLLQGR